MENPPNQTLYLNNLPEKLKKEELKKSLYLIFSQFGVILDIVALKTLKMRGQAFVVFQDIGAAGNALRKMQGFPFFEKPMRIAYGKSKSNAVAKLDKTYVEPVRPAAGKGGAAAAAAGKRAPGEKRKAARDDDEDDDETADARRKQRRVDSAAAATAATPSSSQPLLQPPVGALQQQPGLLQPGSTVPNSMLFLQNLPAEVTHMMLNMLFSQFPGFKEVRLPEGMVGLGFVDFEGEAQAAVAMGQLQGFQIAKGYPMNISYAKKG